MAFCHGSGAPESDGCCYVNGQVCPNRLDQTQAQAWLSGLNLRGARLRAAQDQIANITYLCRAALEAVAVDPSILTTRALFEAAWEARPEYQPIADAWQAIGKPRNWCMSFGPFEGQCCFAENDQINNTKFSILTETAVTIRKALVV